MSEEFRVDRRNFLKGLAVTALAGSAFPIAQGCQSLEGASGTFTIFSEYACGCSAGQNSDDSVQSKVQEIAQWVSSLTYETIPDRVIQKAKYQLLNVVASIHSGYKYPPGRAVVDLVEGWAGKGNSTIMPVGIKTSSRDAVFANATLSICYDFDDYLFMGHTGHSSVTVSLALAESLDLTFRDVLLAQVIANEIGGRIGGSILFGKMNGQLWSPIHSIAAACAASKLLGLSAEQIEHAIGIAMYQPTFTQFPGFLGPDSKLLTASSPTVTGILATELAEKGLTGSAEILDHRQGFVSNFACLGMPFMLTGWGSSWVTDTLTFKIYPGDAYIDTTIDAVMSILDDYQQQTESRLIPPESIQQIEIDANILTVMTEQMASEYTDWAQLSPININFTVKPNVAIAILAGELTTRQLALEELARNRDEILALSEKVILEHDPSSTFDMFATVGETIDLRKVLNQFSLDQLIRGIKCMNEFYDSECQEMQYVQDLVQSGDGAHFSPSQSGGGCDFDLGDYDLETLRIPFRSRVRVTLTDGGFYEASRSLPLGAPGSEPEAAIFDRVEDKFRFEATELLSLEQIEEAIAAVAHLESVDIKDFLALVTSPSATGSSA